jgi:branched-chain amino acid transport system permease protein
MRFLFKTDYTQDLRIFKFGIQKFWYGALAIFLLALPFILPESLRDYYLGQMVFIGIYTIVGLGLMLLIGFTGQMSLGHAAFLAIGAYTETILQAKGVPFYLSLPASGLLAGACGILIGVPALRLKGIYLAIATFAFGFIVEEVITRWKSLTHGNEGITVQKIDLIFTKVDSEREMYYLVLFLAVVGFFAMINLLRSPTGRAFVAVRDSEVSAQSMGIHLAYYKTLAFVLSAVFTGIAGALYAHKVQFISPEQFSIIVSIEMATIVFIGGLGSLHGAVFGSIFIIALPQVITILKDYLPAAIGQATGLQPTIFGLILVGFLLFEPLGIYGRWVKIRAYFSLFPLYRRGMFRRQRAYMKSDRLK